MLVELWKKGLLEGQKVRRAYAYHAVPTREQWTSQSMAELLVGERLAGGEIERVELDERKRALES